MLKTLTLKDISINKGRQGLVATAQEDGRIPFLRITDIDDYCDIEASALKATDNPNAEKYLLKENDIAFARTGSNIWKNYFYDTSDGDIAYSSFLIKFSIDPCKVNPKYVKYYCQSEHFRNWTQRHQNEHTRSHINVKTYESMPIPIPSLQEQKRIVEALEIIEKKINISKKIDANLKSQIRAYFNKCKQLEGSSSGVINDLIEFKTGGSHKKLPEGDIPCYSSGGVLRYVAGKMPVEESVLIPRKGSLNNVMYVNHPFYAGDTMYYTAEKKDGVLKYVHCILKEYDMMDFNVGTATPSLDSDMVKNIKIRIPSDDELKIFNENVSPLYKMISNNKREREILYILKKTKFSKFLCNSTIIYEN